MLSELYIDNIAVIEKASVVLGEGFNVFTGETGAGKSILLDSINAIIGERTSKDLIRSGCTKASVTALFCDISKRVSEKCAELGYEVDESGLLISRELTIDGRANCRICGKPATVSMLKEIGGDLIDIHGQHDNKNLLSAERHIRFIDNFGELQDEIKTYKDLYYNMVDIRQRLEAINTDESEKARKIDLLRYQIEEIDEANLTETEEDELIAERKMVKNSSRILDGLNAAYECLTGDGDAEGGCGLVSSASEAVSASAEYMDNLAEMSERLQGISIELEEFASDIRSALDDFEFDPRRIDYIEARLDVIYKLKRKYGAAVKDVLDYCENARRELEEIELSDELSEKLTAQLKKATEQAERQAEKLSGLRKKHAESFVQKVLSELAFLDMPNVIFTVEHNITEMKPNGVDSMEFMISTNPAKRRSPFHALPRAASFHALCLQLKM